MDRRAYLISVFDDTLERINGDFELHKAQQQSIAAQKLILETETLDVSAPRFDEKASVICYPFVPDHLDANRPALRCR